MRGMAPILGYSPKEKGDRESLSPLHMVEQFHEQNNSSLSKKEYWLRVFAYALRNNKKYS